MATFIGIAVLVVIAVLFFKGFDMIAGRGPKQAKDGINKCKLGQSDSGRVPCPQCAEMIMPEAKLCPFYKSPLMKQQ